jgi:hypothetical protein
MSEKDARSVIMADYEDEFKHIQNAFLSPHYMAEVKRVKNAIQRREDISNINKNLAILGVVGRGLIRWHEQVFCTWSKSFVSTIDVKNWNRMLVVTGYYQAADRLMTKVTFPSGYIIYDSSRNDYITFLSLKNTLEYLISRNSTYTKRSNLEKTPSFKGYFTSEGSTFFIVHQLPHEYIDPENFLYNHRPASFNSWYGIHRSGDFIHMSRCMNKKSMSPSVLHIEVRHEYNHPLDDRYMELHPTLFPLFQHQ